MRALRLTQEVRIVWIDQICINQDDLEERSQQVQLMRDIYQTASRVLIWLGDYENDSSDALSFLPRLSKVLAAHLEEKISTDSLTSISLPIISDKIWVAVGHLFQRPWFRRVWTAQEAIMSRNSVLLCGESQLPWNILLSAIDVLWHHHALLVEILNRVPRDQVLGINWAPSQVTAIKQTRAGYYQDTEKNSFLEILSAFANCEATNPRDKIFALLGVLPDAERLCFEAPDYTKTVEQVYIDTAQSFIQQNSLEIILYSGACKQILRLPSWVPDWSAPISTSSFGRACKYSARKSQVSCYRDPVHI